MNERIRELAWQAANGMLSYDAEGDFRLSEKEVEKFAELIVQECMNAIYDIDDLGGYHFKAVNAVKQHFGVE